MTPAEERELFRLVSQAWDLRDTPYVHDAVEAIITWHETRVVRELDRRDEELGRLIRLLRETDPARLRATRRAA